MTDSSAVAGVASCGGGRSTDEQIALTGTTGRSPGSVGAAVRATLELVGMSLTVECGHDARLFCARLVETRNQGNSLLGQSMTAPVVNVGARLQGESDVAMGQIIPFPGCDGLLAEVVQRIRTCTDEELANLIRGFEEPEPEFFGEDW